MPMNEIQFMLTVPEARQNYMAFVNSELSTENAQCWTECMKYKADPSKTKALDIINTYVAEGAPRQVNLSTALRVPLLGVRTQYQTLQASANTMGFSERHQTANLRKADANVFDELVGELENLMSRDTLARFINTTEGAAWHARYQEAIATMPGHPVLYARVKEKGRALRAWGGL
jgi:hypothetical protein